MSADYSNGLILSDRGRRVSALAEEKRCILFARPLWKITGALFRANSRCFVLHYGPSQIHGRGIFSKAHKTQNETVEKTPHFYRLSIEQTCSSVTRYKKRDRSPFMNIKFARWQGIICHKIRERHGF
jgi:hypothetical protein